MELTLPSELRQLVGLRCTVTLHDGARPDIVLRPDISPAMTAFAAVWTPMAMLFADDGSMRAEKSFPAAAFSFGLLPRPGGAGQPYLCWQDGLALAAGRADAGALARLIAACAEQQGAELSIVATLAAPFGAVCGFLATGALAFSEWQEACDIAAAEFAAGTWQPGAPLRASPDAGADRFWACAAAPLNMCADLFAGWSLPGSAYPALRAAWRRGRSIELNRG